MLMENTLVQFMNYLPNSPFLFCLLPRVHRSIIISHGPGKSNLFFNSFMKLAVPFQYLLFSSKVITFNWNMSLNDLHCPSNAHFLFMILQPSEMHRQMSLCCIFFPWRLVGAGSGQQAWWPLAGSLTFQVPVSKNNKPPEFPIGISLHNSISATLASLLVLKYTGCGSALGSLHQISPRHLQDSLPHLLCLCPSALCFNKAYPDHLI